MKLRTYIIAYIKFKLNINLYSVEEIVSEVYIALLTNAKLSMLLRPYIAADKIPPKGRLLSLLKAVIFRTRLKYINKENVHLAGKRNIKIHEIYEKRLESKKFSVENDTPYSHLNTKKSENNIFLAKNLKKVK